jgi:Fe-S-cluster formation regulator IscX/YfhJ
VISYIELLQALCPQPPFREDPDHTNKQILERIKINQVKRHHEIFLEMPENQRQLIEF